ncbi:MAG: family finger-like protein [Deltaproteobacteria bacterium]|nr:family finger-like protein [Deltaproteobacteria bacterium]
MQEPERAPEPPPEPLPALTPEPLPEPPPKAEAPPIDETTRAMVDLLREIDETVDKLPVNSPEAPVPSPEPPPELPPELTAPDAGGGKKQGYQGPVRVTPRPEPGDGTEALVSVLEDLFKPGSGAVPSAGPAPQADQAKGAEPRKPSVPKEPPKAPPSRPPYASPLFILVVALWVLLLAGAALLFGTDYFDKWVAAWKAPKAGSAVAQKAAAHVSYEIRDLKWFSDNSFDGGALFAVTGTVTLHGASVSDGIQVRATIMGRDNTVISEKVVYAGNHLDNTTLRHTKPEVVDSFLSRKVEKGGVNIEIPDGETLPFMAVFFDPPERVYSVVVKAIPAVK